MVLKKKKKMKMNVFGTFAHVLVSLILFLESRLLSNFADSVKFPLVTRISVSAVVCQFVSQSSGSWDSFEIILSMANPVVFCYHLPLLSTTYLYSIAVSNF